MDPSLHVIQNTTKGENGRICRGIMSHTMAVRQNIKAVVNDEVEYMVHTDCVDEASMWVKKALTNAQKADLKLRMRERRANGQETQWIRKKCSEKSDETLHQCHSDCVRQEAEG